MHSSLRGRQVTSALVLVASAACGASAGGFFPEPPKVVAAWAAGPFEARIAFDRAVDPSVADAMTGQTITFTEPHPTATGGRGTLRIAAARIVDGRTLVLTTDPHPGPGVYVLTLRSLRAPGGTTAALDPQVDYGLSGVEAAWTAQGATDPEWVAWWPAFDPGEVRTRAGAAADVGRSLDRLGKPGTLSLTTMLTLSAVSQFLTVEGVDEATFGGENPQSAAGGSFRFPVGSPEVPTLLVLTRRTPLGSKPIRVTHRSGGGLSFETPVWGGGATTTLPWAPLPPSPSGPPANAPSLKGGDPARGAAVFASQEAKCASCHKVKGKGGDVGPDLSAFAGRDRVEVYRDIAEPSARIHPDYVPYTIALKDGRVLAGTVRAEGAGSIKVTDTEAKSTVVPRAEVEELRPSATSIMPVGLVGVIGEEKLRDLIAYLTDGGP